MTSNKALYAICIKSGAITNQIVGTSHEIVPGQLLKIISEKFKESCVIKLLERDNKRFGKDLYKCNKESIKELNDKDWAVISELNKGDNITVTLEVQNIKKNVNFSIISIGDIPSLGAGVFFALELVDTTDLNEDFKFQLRMKYYVKDLSAFCIRGDKLLDGLNAKPTSTNYNPPQSNGPNSATYITPSSDQTFTNFAPIEESLIDFRDVIPSKKIILEPPVILNVNQSVPGDNLIDLQLQQLKNGLGDLRILTEKEPNGMNEYARTHFPFNLNKQDLQARNVNILENRFDGSATYMRHSTPASEHYYREDNVRDFPAFSKPTSNNIPAAILRKSQENTENSSIPHSLTHFVLPLVDHEEKPIILTESSPSNSVRQKLSPPHKNILKTQQNNENLNYRFELPPTYQDKPSIAVEPSGNFLRQNSPQPPLKVNVPKNTNPRKYRRKNFPNHNKQATKCYICHKLIVNIIELNCQHLCCPECLIGCLSNLEDAHCPFKRGNYECNFKFEADDLGSIFEAIENSLSEPGSNYTKILPKPKPHIVEPRPSVKKVEEELFEYNDNDSNEVLFYCKREKCEGYWFVDKTEGRNTYPCPLCETYNCFKCQVIHDRMTCEEYNQHNPVHPYNNSRLENPSNEPTWKCEFCSFIGNLANTAICVVCSRTNDSIMQTKQINPLEYYRLIELEENEDFVPNFDEFECVICTEMIEPDNGVQLRGCLHNICLVCIEKYIAVNEVPEIKCPFDGCTNILEDREIKRLVSPDVYARYLGISLRVGKTQIKNGYQCCVPNCEGFWIYTENTYAYNCPACLTENCISCKASHPSINCKTYQQNIFYSKDKNGIETRKKLEQMLANGEAEHCPKCNIIVVKNGGCPSMNCSMCKTNFTWGRMFNKNLQIK